MRCRWPPLVSQRMRLAETWTRGSGTWQGQHARLAKQGLRVALRPVPAGAQRRELLLQRAVLLEAAMHRDPALAVGLALQHPGQLRQPVEARAERRLQGRGVADAIGLEHRQPAEAVAPGGEEARLGREGDRGMAERAQQRVLVVAEHALAAPRGAQRLGPLQHPGRVRAAVDEVAQQHHLALRLVEDAAEAIAPAMHIADEGHSHPDIIRASSGDGRARPATSDRPG